MGVTIKKEGTGQDVRYLTCTDRCGDRWSVQRDLIWSKICPTEFLDESKTINWKKSKLKNSK